LAPSLFDLDDTGLAVPILDAVSEPDVESLRMAVDGCPRAAVFIADDE
jgi:ferredoxin